MTEKDNYDQIRSYWRSISTKTIKIGRDGIKIDQIDQNRSNRSKSAKIGSRSIKKINVEKMNSTLLRFFYSELTYNRQYYRQYVLHWIFRVIANKNTRGKVEDILLYSSVNGTRNN